MERMPPFLHPDKSVSLAKIRNRPAKSGMNTAPPSHEGPAKPIPVTIHKPTPAAKPAVTPGLAKGSAFLAKLAYKMHDSGFAQHLNRLARAPDDQENAFDAQPGLGRSRPGGGGHGGAFQKGGGPEHGRPNSFGAIQHVAPPFRAQSGAPLVNPGLTAPTPAFGVAAARPAQPVAEVGQRPGTPIGYVAGNSENTRPMYRRNPGLGYKPPSPIEKVNAAVKSVAAGPPGR